MMRFGGRGGVVRYRRSCGNSFVKANDLAVVSWAVFFWRRVPLSFTLAYRTYIRNTFTQRGGRNRYKAAPYKVLPFSEDLFKKDDASNEARFLG